MPRILFCAPTPISPRLGASKVYIEAAEAFRRIGWETTLIGNEQLGAASNTPEYCAALRAHLQAHAAQFDVVDYEHLYLPFPRADFPSPPLFVARSVLLAQAVYDMRLPPIPSSRGRLAWLVKGWLHRRRQRHWVEQGNLTLTAADLINVGNTDDRERLMQAGHPAEKIVVFPFGLFPERLAQFKPPDQGLPSPPIVAFVGTFDPRKGMVEFPKIVAAVSRQHPEVRFRLLGTAGLIPTAERVLSFFPRGLRSRLEVIPRYEPNDLPRWLADCSLGIFPSHCEGFGFGVLEMLAAGLPVVAYQAPGPPMMLPPEYLAPRGDWNTLAQRVSALLAAPAQLQAARLWARTRAADFRWEEIARQTAAVYERKRAVRGADKDKATRRPDGA